MGKKYVKVIAGFDKDGHITPLKLIWDDEQSYDITKVINVNRAASAIAGGTGYRYEVIIEGKKRFLWLEDIVFNRAIGAKWFVEAKD